eukprot:TRINITY_DN257_c0_g1_i1.p1 TRINITY_DN257_c0_g1~~TRINITY_DN257_c0_g1_i1.p1  ORF type:complete len:356 (+),score=13.91 TRINITY_DN257_c0_g1_i1:12-1079(+)
MLPRCSSGLAAITGSILLVLLIVVVNVYFSKSATNTITLEARVSRLEHMTTQIHAVEAQTLELLRKSTVSNFDTETAGNSKTGTNDAPPLPAQTPLPPAAYPSSRVFRLSTTCDMNTNGIPAKDFFNAVYEKNSWGRGLAPRSGSGSSLRGAFDWATKLQSFIPEADITSVADIPCGDVGWQMASPLNDLAGLYFGGDIALWPIKMLQQRFKDHHNKMFQHWDLAKCGVPKWSEEGTAKWNTFDLIMTRDVFQHMDVNRVIEAVRRIVLESGAKYWIVSSYPEKCHTFTNCKGPRKAGTGAFHNAMKCGPFNFTNVLWEVKSHQTFPIESDLMTCYKVEDLKPIVESWGDSRLCP